MYTLIGSWQINGAPIRPLHATLHLTVPPPTLSSLVAWLLSPFAVVSGDFCLPPRLAAVGQTCFIACFSIAILSGNPTPVPSSQASLLGPEPLVAGHSIPHRHRELLLSFPFSLTQSALFPIRGACILNVLQRLSLWSRFLCSPSPHLLSQVRH